MNFRINSKYFLVLFFGFSSINLKATVTSELKTSSLPISDENEKSNSLSFKKHRVLFSIDYVKNTEPAKIRKAHYSITFTNSIDFRLRKKNIELYNDNDLEQSPFYTVKIEHINVNGANEDSNNPLNNEKNETEITFAEFGLFSYEDYLSDLSTGNIKALSVSVSRIAEGLTKILKENKRVDYSIISGELTRTLHQFNQKNGFNPQLEAALEYNLGTTLKGSAGIEFAFQPLRDQNWTMSFGQQARKTKTGAFGLDAEDIPGNNKQTVDYAERENNTYISMRTQQGLQFTLYKRRKKSISESVNVAPSLSKNTQEIGVHIEIPFDIK